MSLAAALRLAFAFDPVASLVAGIASAILLTRTRTGFGYGAAATVLVIGWSVGEGLAQPLLDGTLAAHAAKVGSGTYWTGVFGALLVAYVFPAWAGSFVGRRVVWGTGWASAAAVAAMATSVASVFASRIR